MRTPAVPGKAETIPFYFTVKLANLPALLRAQTCSLVQFDRGGSHFQPLVREVAWTEVMDAEDVAPMEEEEAAADAADEWQGLEGLWMATRVQGASTVDDLVPYRLQIPVDHHPLLQAGNEVRFQAPGADHSKVYVLPAGPFAEGKAFTFTVLLHPQAAMGDVSVTDLEVRVCDPADREVAAIADAALLADEEGEEAAPEAAIAAPSVAVIAAPAVATVAVVAAPAVAAPPAVATAAAAAPAAATAAVAVAVEATPARAQKKRRGAANRALQAMDEQADDEDEGSRHEVKKVKRHQPPTKELTMAEALVGPFAALSPVAGAPAWLGDALEPESGAAARMLGKYVCFYWQDWGFAVGKLVAPTAADANFGVVYPQWGTEAQTLTLEAYGLAGGAGTLPFSMATSRRSRRTPAESTRWATSGSGRRSCRSTAPMCSASQGTPCAPPRRSRASRTRRPSWRRAGTPSARACSPRASTASRRRGFWPRWSGTARASRRCKSSTWRRTRTATRAPWRCPCRARPLCPRRT